MIARDYLALLQALLPAGPAWSREVRRNSRGKVVGGNLSLLLDAFAQALQAFDDRCQALVQEANPMTAKQLLAARYDEASLPFACLPRADNPDQQRAEVLYAWSALGGASPAYFAFILSKLDIPFRIREFPAFRIGQTPIGSAPLYSDQWAYWWQVSAVDTAYRHFRAGNSTAGDPLQEWSAQAIVCLINTLKPAHTRVIFRFVLDEQELEWAEDDFGADGLVTDDAGIVLLGDYDQPIYFRG
ncbi:putative phage tail protein [Methylolobus aquaticus]